MNMKSFSFTRKPTHLTPSNRCQKRLPSGDICGKNIGHCIHYFVPTAFGPQTEIVHNRKW